MALALYLQVRAPKRSAWANLYEAPAARVLYDEANAVLGWDLHKISFEGLEAELTETKVCQPALYVHGMALLAAIQEIKGPGFRPEMALGLSLGELTAYAARALSIFGTGLRVVAERGAADAARLQADKPRHGRGRQRAERRRSLGALPANLTSRRPISTRRARIIISGEKARSRRASRRAKARGMKKVIPLKVAGAYHSRLMDPARAAFSGFLATVPFSPPRFPVFTNTTGKAISDPAAIKTALGRQLVSSVLWEDCLRSAAAAGATPFWELGPGGVLAGLARRTDKTWACASVAEFADLKDIS